MVSSSVGLQTGVDLCELAAWRGFADLRVLADWCGLVWASRLVWACRLVCALQAGVGFQTWVGLCVHKFLCVFTDWCVFGNLFGLVWASEFCELLWASRLVWICVNLQTGVGLQTGLFLQTCGGLCGVLDF